MELGESATILGVSLGMPGGIEARYKVRIDEFLFQEGEDLVPPSLKGYGCNAFFREFFWRVELNCSHNGLFSS